MRKILLFEIKTWIVIGVPKKALSTLETYHKVACCLLLLSNQTDRPTDSTEQNPSWRANKCSAIKKLSALYGTLEVHSSEPTVCPYPQPDQSSPRPPPTSWKSNLLFSSHPCLGLPSSLPLLGFPTTTLYVPLSSPAHLILLDLITWQWGLHSNPNVSIEDNN